MIIAIDGPAGAGKSTISARVARELGFQLVDTGAIYRTVALEALRLGIDLDDGPTLAELATNLEFAFEFDGADNAIVCNGTRLGDEIRTPRVSRAASIVSAQPELRASLLDIQREIGRANDSVLEGRDIGTVVFPDADVKIFLTATPEERARRRVEQMAESGEEADYDAVLEAIRRRDARDENRAHSPLVQAEDALAIDSTSHSPDEVVEAILARVEAHSGA